ncbi:hypothetical protein LG293_16005 (plasmid) [Citricoccus nitrophenolicus]
MNLKTATEAIDRHHLNILNNPEPQTEKTHRKAARNRVGVIVMILGLSIAFLLLGSAALMSALSADGTIITALLGSGLVVFVLTIFAMFALVGEAQEGRDTELAPVPGKGRHERSLARAKMQDQHASAVQAARDELGPILDELNATSPIEKYRITSTGILRA